MAKRVKEDLIKWELDINASPAQKSLHATAVETKNLEKANKELEKQMKLLKKQGLEGSEEWQALNKTYSENTQAIDKNKKKMDELYKSMDNSEKTISQLRDEAGKLTRELNNMTRGTDAYNAKAEQLAAVQSELKDATGQSQAVMSKGEAVMSAVSAKAAILTGVFVGMGLKIVSLVGDYLSLNKIMNSNQTTGDELANELFGLQRAMETLQVRMANLDFKGLVRDMIDAYTAGKEVSAMLDELFERENSFKISSAQQSALLVELQEKMRDVNLSYEDRQAAANEIMRITREQAAVEKDISLQKAEAYKKDLQVRTKLSDAELEYIVDRYNQNRSEISQAAELIALQQKLSNLKKDAASSDATTRNLANEFSRDLQTQIDLILVENAGIEETAKMLEKYNLSNDDLVKNYVESRVQAINIESQAEQSLMRVKTTNNGLTKQIAEEQRKATEANVAAKNKELDATLKAQEQEQKTAAEKLKQKEDLLKKISTLQSAFDESQMSAADRVVYQLAKKYQAIQSELDVALEKQLITQEEHAAKSLELQSLHAKEELAVIEANREKITDTLEKESKQLDSDAYRIQQELLADNLDAKRDLELEALRELHNMKKLSDEEFAKASMNIQLKYLQSRLQKERQLLTNAAGISDSLQDYALSKVEARYQRELAAAGDNATKKAAVEEEYEKGKLEVQKRYADINFAIKSATIIADTAMAIMQAYAQLGPIAGSVAAAMLGTVGAVQLAAANQERQRVKSMTWSGTSSGSQTEESAQTGTVVLRSGYQTGGYTGEDIGVNEVAGVVHGQEYVIPAWQMKMPETVQIVKELESIRTSRNPKKGYSHSSSRGYEGGGYVGSESYVTRDEINTLVTVLNRLIDTPLKAYVVLSELDKARKRQEKSENYASKGG
ncbi:MAG: hypothetical protein RR202_10565 [Bacteroidales bacterium]